MEQKAKEEEDCNKTNVNICVKKISKKTQRKKKDREKGRWKRQT